MEVIKVASKWYQISRALWVRKIGRLLEVAQPRILEGLLKKRHRDERIVCGGKNIAYKNLKNI